MINFLAFVLALLLPTVAQAATYYVATTGSGSTCSLASPCLTVATGLTKLTAPGDTLYIRAGTYHERILYTQMIPSGTAGNPVTISAYPGETVWLDGSSATNVPLINLHNSGPNTALKYIVFDGINLDCLHVSGGDGCVGMGPPSGTVVENITFQNYEAKNTNSTNGAPGGFAPAHIINGNFHTFRNCYVHDNGLTPKPVDNFGGYAFYINGDDHTIDNCRMDNHGGYAIQAFKSGTTNGANRITISNNKIYNTGLNSIGTTTGGIVVGSGSGHRVFNNTISTGFDGIEVSYTCTDCVIAGNTIYNSSSVGITLAATVVRPVVTNNIIRNSGVLHISDEGSTSPSFNTNMCSGSIGTPNCTFSSNPLFVDEANRDFNLQVSSPALNVGTTLSSPYNTDINGTTRPNGAFDLGAYESGTTATCPTNPHLLAAQYTFNSVATDSAGNGAGTATLGSGVTYTAAHSGNGLLLPGTAGATVADVNVLDMCDQFTLEAWVNIPSSLTDVMFIVKNPGSKYFLGMLAGMCSAGPALVGGYSQTTAVIACDPTAITPNTDIHLAVTYDGSNVRLYRNAGLVATSAGGAILDATTGTLQFCTSGFAEHCANATKQDEVKIYTYARSAAEIFDDMGPPVGGGGGRVVKIGSGQSLKIGMQ